MQSRRLIAKKNSWLLIGTGLTSELGVSTMTVTHITGIYDCEYNHLTERYGHGALFLAARTVP
jgi:hypothetical protein